MVKKKTVHEKVIREVIEKPKKKRTRKKTTKKKSAKRKSTSKKSDSYEKTQKALIENFISLQKIMVNFSNKFDNLSGQISKLLELFEISAKALAEKEFVTDKEKKDNHDVLQKMDEIINQNKVLARGMTLMHDRISEQEEMPFTQQVQQIPSQSQITKPLPKMPSRSLPSMPQKSTMNPNNPPTSVRHSPPMSEPSSPVRPLPSKSQYPDDSYQKSISSATNNDSEQKQKP